MSLILKSWGNTVIPATPRGCVNDNVLYATTPTSDGHYAALIITLGPLQTFG